VKDASDGKLVHLDGVNSSRAWNLSCKLICELDLEQGLCKGCGRSREEIARWTRYSDVQRAFIMTELEGRLKLLSK